MAGSFTCLRYHLVFSTKDRKPLLRPEGRPRLFEFIGGILRARKGHLIGAGGTDNHVHLVALLPRDRSISDILRDIKTNSSTWINEHGLCGHGFHWQDGYGAFTVGGGEVDALLRYVSAQQEHHREQSFEEEFVAFLEANQIAYDARYIWR